MSLTTSLVSYWNLDEASGNRADSHGTNTLTDNNTVASATGKIGTAGDFEKNNSEWLSHADNADLSTGDIDWTVQAWVQLESKPAGDYMCVVGKGGSGGEYALFWNAPDDRFYLYVNGAFGSIKANTFGAPSLATWYCLHIWHDSVNNLVGISVNAGTADTASYSGGITDGTGAFAIGRDEIGPAGYWDGLIDEVGFWKRVLTSQERTDLYNAGAGFAYPFVTSVPRLPLLGVG